MSDSTLAKPVTNASPADRVTSKLDGVQGGGPRWRAICPGHESKHRTRTLSIREENDGRVLLRCHAGCSVESITSALGLDLADLFPPRPGSDEQRGPRVRKPWSARDVLAALAHELGVAWIVLADVGAGKQITQADRRRAGVARERVLALMQEIEHAR